MGEVDVRRILVLKLTRMGDIIEAAPLLRAIRCQEPDAHVTMLVNRSFRAAAELLDGLDEILDFPISAFAEELRFGEQDLLSHYDQLAKFVDQLSAMKFDLILNVTNSGLSGALMGFLRSGEQRGLVYGDDGGRRVSGRFLRYFAPNQGMRRYCAFNLSDFMRQLYGGPLEPCEGGLRLSQEVVLEGENLLEDFIDHPLLGLQPGASETCKRWRVGDFAETARRVLEVTDARCIILGGADEIPLATAILDRIGPLRSRVRSLVGQTSIASLAAVTARLKTLVSNDTGTMHLAAICGVPVINLSLGSAFFRETGPYGVGHLILDPVIDCRPCDFFVNCSHFDCKTLIRPGMVADLAISKLKGETWAPLHCQSFEGVDLYETAFDENGLLEYVRLTPRPYLTDELLLHVYRFAVCQVELGGDIERGRERALKRILQDGAGLGHGVSEELVGVRRNLDQLWTLADRGIRLTEQGEEARLAQNLTALKLILDSMAEVDQRLATFGSQHLHCRYLTRAALLDKEAVRGDDLEVLLAGHERVYRRLRKTVELGTTTLDEAVRRLLEQVSDVGSRLGRRGVLPPGHE